LRKTKRNFFFPNYFNKNLEKNGLICWKTLNKRQNKRFGRTFFALWKIETL